MGFLPASFVFTVAAFLAVAVACLLGTWFSLRRKKHSRLKAGLGALVAAAAALALGFVLTPYLLVILGAP